MTTARLIRHRSDWPSVLFVLNALTLVAVQWSGRSRHPVLHLADLCLAFPFLVLRDHMPAKSGDLRDWGRNQPRFLFDRYEEFHPLRSRRLTLRPAAGGEVS